MPSPNRLAVVVAHVPAEAHHDDVERPGLRRAARSNAAITVSTSPSPKLDSTPATWTSASGQICWMMPVMNVPWPASKSSVPLPSSSYSSSSSMAPTAGSRSHGECSAGARQVRVLDGGALGLRRCAGRCRARGSAAAGAVRRGRAAGAATPAAGAGSDVVLSTGPTSVSMTSAVNIIPPAKCASAPTGMPFTPWLPEHDVVRLGDGAGVAQPRRALVLRPARRSSGARRGSTAGSTPGRSTRRDRPPAAGASRTAAACFGYDLADRRQRSARTTSSSSPTSTTTLSGRSSTSSPVAVDGQARSGGGRTTGASRPSRSGWSATDARCSRQLLLCVGAAAPRA